MWQAKTVSTVSLRAVKNIQQMWRAGPVARHRMEQVNNIKTSRRGKWLTCEKCTHMRQVLGTKCTACGAWRFSTIDSSIRFQVSHHLSFENIFPVMIRCDAWVTSKKTVWREKQKSRVVRQLVLKMEIQFRAETKGTHQLNLRARDESESGAEKNISCMDASKTKVVPERARDQCLATATPLDQVSSRFAL